MAFAVIMPKAGMAMETGTIIRWLKKEGDAVAAGEPLLEIETDKVAMEVEAEADGILLLIVRGDGDEVPVTETIGYIGEEGESMAELPRETPAAKTKPASGEEPQFPAPKASAPDTAERVTAASESVSPAPPARANTNARGTVRATPAARRVAAEHGISLAAVRPSGRSGEVIGSDLLAMIGDDCRGGGQATPAPDLSPPQAPAASNLGPAAGIGDPADRREPLSPMRRAIAATMTRSARIPRYTLHADAYVDDLFAARADMEKKRGIRPGLTPTIVKALGLALADVPEFAAFIDGDSLVHPSSLGIGLAVSVPGGIVVPVMKRVSEMTMEELAGEFRRLVAGAQAGQLAAHDLRGAVTTVSNLGAYGITQFTPMITPPQSSVLGVSAIRSVPVMVDGVLTERRVLGLDLTVDHRVTDGAEAAAFMQTIVRRLEDPRSLFG